MSSGLDRRQARRTASVRLEVTLQSALQEKISYVMAVSCQRPRCLERLRDLGPDEDGGALPVAHVVHDFAIYIHPSWVCLVCESMASRSCLYRKGVIELRPN